MLGENAEKREKAGGGAEGKNKQRKRIVESFGLSLASWLRNRASFFLHYELRQGIIAPVFTRLLNTKELHLEFHFSIPFICGKKRLLLNHKPHVFAIYVHYCRYCKLYFSRPPFACPFACAVAFRISTTIIPPSHQAAFLQFVFYDSQM